VLLKPEGKDRFDIYKDIRTLKEDVAGIGGSSYATSSDYTILDDDGYDMILVTTGAATKTITLPTAADNVDRVIEIMKVDDGAGKVTVDGEGAETVGGFATIDALYEYTGYYLRCDGSNWIVIQYIMPPATNLKAYITGGDQSIPSGVTTTVQFNTIVWDYLSEWNTTSYKFEPTFAGRYGVAFQFRINSIDDGKYAMATMRKNADAADWIQHTVYSPKNGAYYHLACLGTFETISSDYWTFRCRHDQGAARSVEQDRRNTYICIWRIA